MTEETKAAILYHARVEHPRECCGLLVVKHGHECYVPCKNISLMKDTFIIDPEDYARAEEESDILQVIHSHTTGCAKPTPADLAACEATGLPWSIVSLPNEAWSHFKPFGYKAPLIGREWVHGVHDCYSLIVDWFRETHGVMLPDFPRDQEWWKNGGDLYMQNFEIAGFQKVDGPLREGDVIIMQVGSPVPNHGAIYLGDGLMLHHLQNRLSGREIYGDWYKRHTRAIVRHD